MAGPQLPVLLTTLRIDLATIERALVSEHHHGYDYDDLLAILGSIDRIGSLLSEQLTSQLEREVF